MTIGAVFDTETTGLTLHPHAKPKLQPRIIEFAAVLIDHTGKELDSLVFLCHPDQQITPEITRITGLKNEDLKSAPSFAAYIPAVKEFLSQADCLIAHNQPFDHALLSNELRIAGAIKDFPWPRHNMCTVQEFEPIWGRRMRLIELYEHTMGKPYKQTHRALDDVRALAEIVIHHNLISLVPPTTRPAEFRFPTGFEEEVVIRGFDPISDDNKVRTSIS
jgi:DNA polymerase III epsilon subunit-like protein